MPSANVTWPTPLTRLNPVYPGQMGVPGTDNRTGLRLDTNGAIYYVDPNAIGVSNDRDGTDPTEPLQSVATALTKCRPYMNDVIAVAPSAYWIYANQGLGRATAIAEEVVVTVPGVRIVGVYPPGALGVPWRVTQNSGIAIDVQAMDVVIEGFQFYESLYATPIAIRAQWGGPSNLRGENLTVRHCFFYQMDYGIQLNWTYNCFIHHNIFQETVTAAIHNLNTFGDPDYSVIEDNMFTDDTVAINLLDTDKCVIRRNEFVRCTDAIKMTGGSANNISANIINGNPAGAGNFIDLTGGAANMVCDNWFSCTLAQYTGPGGTCDDATSGMWIRNHCQDGCTVSNP
jgi:hypothetical protein